MKKRYLQRETDYVEYHKRFVAYFADSATADPKRKLVEYPVHLMALNAAQEMKEFLSSIEVFIALYCNDVDRYDLFDYWTVAGGKEKSVAAQVYRVSLQRYREEKKPTDQVTPTTTTA